MAPAVCSTSSMSESCGVEEVEHACKLFAKLEATESWSNAIVAKLVLAIDLRHEEELNAQPADRGEWLERPAARS